MFEMHFFVVLGSSCEYVKCGNPLHYSYEYMSTIWDYLDSVHYYYNRPEHLHLSCNIDNMCTCDHGFVADGSSCVPGIWKIYLVHSYASHHLRLIKVFTLHLGYWSTAQKAAMRAVICTWTRWIKPTLRQFLYVRWMFSKIRASKDVQYSSIHYHSSSSCKNKNQSKLFCWFFLLETKFFRINNIIMI